MAEDEAFPLSDNPGAMTMIRAYRENPSGYRNGLEGLCQDVYNLGIATGASQFAPLTRLLAERDVGSALAAAETLERIKEMADRVYRTKQP